MTSLNDLRLTLERQYLEPVTERTPMVPINGALNDSQLTIQITADVLTPDEESLIGPGFVGELDYELVYVTSYDQLTKIITVERGFNGTTKAAHDDRTMFRVPTRWPRADQAEALIEAIDGLYPPLYSPSSLRGTVDTMRYVQLPLNTSRILRARWQDGSKWRDCQAELFEVHPLDDSFAAIQLESGVPTGGLCMVRYATKPVIPDDYTTDIAGLVTKWQRLLVVDAAVRLLSGVDIDAVTQENLTEQMRLDRFPVRSGATITEALIRYREYLLEQAETELIANEPVGVLMADVEYYD